jgi:hypothetical protein
MEVETGTDISNIDISTYAKKLIPRTKRRLDSTLPSREVCTSRNSSRLKAAIATMSSTALPKLRLANSPKVTYVALSRPPTV